MLTLAQAARCKLDAHKAPSLKGLCVDTLLKSGTDEYKALDAHTAASEAVQSVLDEQGRQADAAQPVAVFDGAPRGDSHMPRTLATWQSRRSLECAAPALLGFASVRLTQCSPRLAVRSLPGNGCPVGSRRVHPGQPLLHYGPSHPAHRPVARLHR